jgi:hypothetical protein
MEINNSKSEVSHKIKISNIDDLLNSNLEINLLNNNNSNNTNNNNNSDNSNLEDRLKLLEEKIDIILKNQELII